MFLIIVDTDTEACSEWKAEVAARGKRKDKIRFVVVRLQQARPTFRL